MAKAWATEADSEIPLWFTRDQLPMDLTGFDTITLKLIDENGNQSTGAGSATAVGAAVTYVPDAADFPAPGLWRGQMKARRVADSVWFWSDLFDITVETAY